jgi:hypothetical protein
VVLVQFHRDERPVDRDAAVVLPELDGLGPGEEDFLDPKALEFGGLAAGLLGGELRNGRAGQGLLDVHLGDRHRVQVFGLPARLPFDGGVEAGRDLTPLAGVKAE